MTHHYSELEKVLKAAIEIEDKGMAAFTKYAEETKDENGKKMFLRLAEDEKEHRTILEDWLKNIQEGGTLKKIEIPQTELEKVVPDLRERVKETRKASGPGETDALESALELERKASSFFRENADKVNDPAAKALFLRLAEWEDTHYELIQAEIDYVKNTGIWFGIPEFRMDGKY